MEYKNEIYEIFDLDNDPLNTIMCDQISLLKRYYQRKKRNRRNHAKEMPAGKRFERRKVKKIQSAKP